jgi:hypothetical protein
MTSANSRVQNQNYDGAMAHIIKNVYQEKPLDQSKLFAADRIAFAHHLGPCGRFKSWVLWAVSKGLSFSLCRRGEKAVTDFRAASIAKSALDHTLGKPEIGQLQEKLKHRKGD